jgi:hypothetical protein
MIALCICDAVMKNHYAANGSAVAANHSADAAKYRQNRLLTSIYRDFAEIEQSIATTKKRTAPRRPFSSAIQITESHA